VSRDITARRAIEVYHVAESQRTERKGSVHKPVSKIFLIKTNYHHQLPEVYSSDQISFQTATLINGSPSSPVMKARISTGAYQELSLSAALECVSRISDSAEVLSEGRHSLLIPENVEVLQTFKLKYTVHGAVSGVNIASLDPGIRSASVALHKREIALSAKVGASLYVVHPGYLGRSFQAFRTTKALEKSLEELKAAEVEYGIRVALENLPKCPWPFFSSPGLDLKGLGIALDVGHANTCGLLNAFLTRPEVVHVHLHDNKGRRDDHLAIGQGNVDFGPVLEMISARKITAVLEHNSEMAVMESIKALRAFETMQKSFIQSFIPTAWRWPTNAGSSPLDTGCKRLRPSRIMVR
jgi:sugar phosphate isomerase/epimerase